MPDDQRIAVPAVALPDERVRIVVRVDQPAGLRYAASPHQNDTTSGSVHRPIEKKKQLPLSGSQNRYIR